MVYGAEAQDLTSSQQQYASQSSVINNKTVLRTNQVKTLRQIRLDPYIHDRFRHDETRAYAEKCLGVWLSSMLEIFGEVATASITSEIGSDENFLPSHAMGEDVFHQVPLLLPVNYLIKHFNQRQLKCFSYFFLVFLI